HFQYLACIGLISLAVSTGTAICKRAGPWGRNLGTVAAATALLVLGVSTGRQARIYQDLTTLWRDTLTKNPQCWMALGNLGNVFLREGKISDAIRYYEQALRIKPDYVEMQCNLGLALAQVGKIQEAMEHYEQALRIRPDLAMAHCNLGVALAQAGRIPEAIEHLQQALRIRPDYAEAHYNLGTALARLGRLPEAVGHWEQALRIKPDYAEVHYNLAVALVQLDRLPEAIEQYEQSLRLYPDDVKTHYDLGLALVRLGRLQEAMGHWEQALRIKPDYPEAQNNLAWLMATRTPADGGDPARAVTLAERACQLTNNRVVAYLDTLAAAYAATGRFNDAVATAQKAIELAKSARQPQVLKDIELHLELYRAGRPIASLQP
ncbi:MAG: tetratricopeptide repeat protein, partial [Verrucomicrobiia bacterium]